MIFLATQASQVNVTTPTFLGESWGFWCQFIVVLLTAIIAIYTLMKNERRARRRATIDIVLSENQDDKFREVKEEYAKMRSTEVNFTLLACEKPEDEERKQKLVDQQEVLIAILNQYEFIACAIKEDSLDESLYKRMKKSVVIRDWRVLEGFVLELRKREKRDKIFCEIECLAKKWENEKK